MGCTTATEMQKCEQSHDASCTSLCTVPILILAARADHAIDRARSRCRPWSRLRPCYSRAFVLCSSCIQSAPLQIAEMENSRWTYEVEPARPPQARKPAAGPVLRSVGAKNRLMTSRRLCTPSRRHHLLRALPTVCQAIP